MRKLLFTLSALTLTLTGCSNPLDDRAIHRDALDLAKRYVEAQGGDSDLARMSSSLDDLNGDHLDDVMVYIWDEPTLCTGQGCTMLVFENRGDRLKLISDIRNVHVRLGSEAGDSDWETLIIASKDAMGKDHVGGEPATVYELAFDPKSKKGYPEDATQGTLQTW